jgi:hypothetical protein
VVPTPASSFPTTSTSSKFLSLESLFDTFDTPVQGSILEELEDEEISTTHAQEVLTLRDSFFRSGPALFPTGTMMGSATKCDYVSFRNYILNTHLSPNSALNFGKTFYV